MKDWEAVRTKGHLGCKPLKDKGAYSVKGSSV